MWEYITRDLTTKSQVSKKDFDDFDYVLCMDESNLSDLKVN